MSTYTEDHLVEQPAVQLMQHVLGWEVVICFGEWDGGASDLGRDGKREVVLTGRLKPALRRLNPDLPVDHPSPKLRMAWAIEGAVEERGMLNVGSVVAFGYAGASSGVAGGYAGTSSWILNGRGRRPTAPRLNPFHPALGRTMEASPGSLALAIHRLSK